MKEYNLEPTAEIRKELLLSVEKHISKLFEETKNQTVYKGDGKQLKTLTNSYNSPQSIDNILSDITAITKDSLNATSGGHFAYIPAGGIYYSALADYIANVLNKYTGLESTAKKAIQIENHLIRFVGGKLVGYSEKKLGGNLTTGGSLANLTAMVAARDTFLAKNKKGGKFKKEVVFISKHTHHCVAKALRIIGLSDKTISEGGNIFYVDTNDQHKMSAKSLKKAIKKCKKKGLVPWLIVATAGTTNLGTTDKLDKIASIAKKERLWFHVDAAYGGFFLLLPKLKKKLFAGINKADSVVLDCHKSLFFPYGLGMVLVKNKDSLLNSFYLDANYINETDKNLKYSPANLSLELTRPFRGLKLWFSLSLLGIKPFQDALQEKIELANYAHKKISQIENIVCLNEPELTTFAFRYTPAKLLGKKHGKKQIEKVNKINDTLVDMIKKDGKIYLSSTKIEINGGTKTFIRFSVLSYRSKKKHIDIAISTIKKKIHELVHPS